MLSTCYQPISPWYALLEIGFCYSICLEKTLQILLYFCNKTTREVFFISSHFYFFANQCMLVFVDLDQGIT